MGQVELNENEEQEVEVVEGTEGTEYEGMSEDDIERAEFDKVVEEDPDIEIEEPERTPEEIEDTGEVEDPEVEDPEVEKEEDPEAKKEEDPEPTGMEFLDDLPEEQRKTVSEFIDRQGQAIARLDQRVKSHLGQLQPAQRALAMRGTEIRELREQLAKQQPATTSLADRQSAYDAWVDEEYTEFPEEATKLKAQFAESLDGLSDAPPATPAAAPATTAGPDQREETTHLATAYSDWGERRFSPEFSEWIAGQPPEMQGQLNSGYASDNIQLLDAFTRDNPDWEAPQAPEHFHSLRQAQFSPLFRGWAEGEGINPDLNAATLPDYQRDSILTRFKSDLGVVVSELGEQEDDPKVTRLASRRSKQLQSRDPGSRRSGVRPGQKIDLSTDEGQRAYYQQLLKADPDLN